MRGESISSSSKFKGTGSSLRTYFWLGIVLACATFSAAWAQTGSVVTVNADNVLVINGRKVFPIGFSPGPPINGKTSAGDDALQEFRDAGALLFRIVQTTDWNAQLMLDQQAALDWAAQHGMYVWLNLREVSKFDAGDTNTPASLRNIVDTFRNHPGLGLCKNFDEAWWGGVSVTQLKNGYDVIKQEDTNHPVVQTHAPRGTVSDLQPYNVAADVLALDIYPVASPPPSNPPITNTQISAVGDWTQVLSQVANGQKEFWLIEQIAFSGTTPPAHPLVFPTFTQSRYMAYQAIINGARGMMFFGGNVAATLTNAQDAALQWNWSFWNSTLKAVVQQLGDHGQLAGALVATNSALPITISGTTVPDLEYLVREAPPFLYILASKREGTSATVTFSGLPAWATNGEVLYESPRNVTATGGQFTDLFAPFDVHVYRFSQTNQAPSVSYPPQNRTNDAATAGIFTVFADGTGPLAYRWRRGGANLSDGGNVSGATSSSLSLTTLASADAGVYDVVIAGFGSVTSASASLTITTSPPSITYQPQSRTIAVGTTANFSVTATGAGTLSYQWRKGGTNLLNAGNVSGATSSSLSVASVTPVDAGNYDVMVSGFGSVTSSPPATLTVVVSPLLFYEPFDYANVGNPVSSNTPANWSFGGTGTNDLKVESGSLGIPGFALGVGNSVTNGGAGLGTRRLFGMSITNGVLYFSALFRINNLGIGAWNGAASQVGALTAPDGATFRLAVMAALSSTTGYVFGVQKGGSGATATFDTTEYHAGDTVLLVGKYDFTSSPNPASLWINPVSTNFGAATEPPGFISATTGTNGYAIDRFNMRQNTAASVPAAMQWDELRVGTTWAAVTPPLIPTLASVKRLTNGAIQFSYTNGSALSYSVYASTNLINWASIGSATLISPGIYQFNDTSATNYSRRFYQLRGN